MGLTVRKRKGSKNYQIRGTVAGVYVEESAGTSDKRAAQLVASKREYEIVQGGVVGRGQSATFLEATVSYLETLGDGKTRKTSEQKRCVGRLLKHFGAKPIWDIGQPEAEARAVALFPGKKGGTVRRSCIGPLQAILNHAEAKFKGYRAPSFDQSKWPAGKGRDRWITPEEAARFLEHATPDVAALFSFLLYTGCRLSDALRLTWADVNLNNRLCTFRDDKNGDDRLCHLPDPAFMALANMRREDKPGRVFFMWRGKERVYGDWRPVTTAAKLKGVTPHILCHTYGTWLVEYAGATAKDLLETKRWKSLTSVMRYLHAPEQRVRDKINALPGQHLVSASDKKGKSNG